MVLALASSRKSRSGCDKPLTLASTCRRVKSSIDVKVPISGVEPGCGPTIHALSEAVAAWGGSTRVESPTASPRPPLRKLRRFGMHSKGNIDRPPQMCPRDHRMIRRFGQPWADLNTLGGYSAGFSTSTDSCRKRRFQTLRIAVKLWEQSGE